MEFESFKILKALDDNKFKLVDKKQENNFCQYTVASANSIDINYFLIFVRTIYLYGKATFNVSVSFRIIDGMIDMAFKKDDVSGLFSLETVNIPISADIEIVSENTDSELKENIDSCSIVECASLYADSLVYLRDYDFFESKELINSNIIDLVPLDEGVDCVKLAFYNSCKNMMKNEAMIYTKSCKFAMPQFVAIKEDICIENIITNSFISRLLNRNILDIIHEKIYGDMDNVKRMYLTSIGVCNVTIYTLIEKINVRFMSTLSEAEIHKLFSFLLNVVREFGHDIKGKEKDINVFRHIPIAKRCNGEWINPSDNSNNNLVYFPIEGIKPMKCCLDKTFIEDLTIREFFEEIGITQMSSKYLVENIDAKYMSSLKKNEINALFNFFLTEAKELWEVNENEHQQKNVHILRYAPISKVGNGEWKSPYAKDNKRNVHFYDGYFCEDTLTLDADFCKDPIVHDFFLKIGIEYCNISVFIKQEVLKRYTARLIGTPSEKEKKQIDDDFYVIMHYYNNVLIDTEKLEFTNYLKGKFRLRLKRKSGYTLSSISEAILPDKKLPSSFIQSGCWKFVDLSYYQKAIYYFGDDAVLNFLKAIGVSSIISVYEMPCRSSDSYLETEYPTEFQKRQCKHSYATHTSIREDYVLEGFMQYISQLGYICDEGKGHMDFLKKNGPHCGYFPVEASKWIWHSICKGEYKLNSLKKSTFGWQYYNWTHVDTNSTFYESVKYTRWLLGNKLPSEVTVEDLLSAGYEFNEDLIDFLGIKTEQQKKEEYQEKLATLTNQFSEAANKLGLSIDDLLNLSKG